MVFEYGTKKVVSSKELTTFFRRCSDPKKLDFYFRVT